MNVHQQVESALSSWYWKFEILEPTNCTVIEYLKSKLPHIPDDSWLERLAWGGVHLNGIRLNQNCKIPIPAKIEYYEPKYPIAKAAEFFSHFDPKTQIIFEDHDLLIIFKPAGISSQPAKEQNQISLMREVSDYLGIKIHMPSRLDKSTCGLIAISKNPEIHARLQRIFEHRQVQKFYLALTSHKFPEDSIECKAYIKKSNLHPVLREPHVSEGVSAHTSFIHLKSENMQSLVIAIPHTGRTHQIRVHLKSLGCEILGDRFYGGTEYPELCLCSYAIKLPHPRTLEPLYFESPANLLPSWIDLSALKDFKSLVNLG